MIFFFFRELHLALQSYESAYVSQPYIVVRIGTFPGYKAAPLQKKTFAFLKDDLFTILHVLWLPSFFKFQAGGHVVRA